MTYIHILRSGHTILTTFYIFIFPIALLSRNDATSESTVFSLSTKKNNKTEYINCCWCTLAVEQIEI